MDSITRRHEKTVRERECAVNRHEKAVRESIEKRFSQGWTPEQIAKRVWLCFGCLTDWTADTVIVKMHAGNATFRKGVAA